MVGDDFRLIASSESLPGYAEAFDDSKEPEPIADHPDQIRLFVSYLAESQKVDRSAILDQLGLDEDEADLPSIEAEESSAVVLQEVQARSEPEVEIPDESPRSGLFPNKAYSSTGIKGARKRDRPENSLDLRIEGLLFVTDAPLTGTEISEILGVGLRRVMTTLRSMIKAYARKRSALELRERLIRGRPAFVLALKPKYRPDVRKIAPPALPPRVIETLALVAMNQPVAQSRLVRERGSKVYDHMRILVERGLVIKTRAGLSYNLSTTQRFCSEFGVSGDPRDLRAMIARAMTPDERVAWDDYRDYIREERQEQRALAAVEAAMAEVGNAHDGPGDAIHQLEQLATFNDEDVDAFDARLSAEQSPSPVLQEIKEETVEEYEPAADEAPSGHVVADPQEASIDTARSRSVASLLPRRTPQRVAPRPAPIQAEEEEGEHLTRLQKLFRSMQSDK